MLGEVQRRLGADYVLDGRLDRSGGQDPHWHSSFTSSPTNDHLELDSGGGRTDYRAVSAEIAPIIASHVDHRIDRAMMEAAQRRTPENLAAYDLWLRAQHLLLTWSPDVEEQAEALLLRALVADPRLARAHSSLALQYNARPLFQPGYRVRCKISARTSIMRGLRSIAMRMIPAAISR